MNNRILFKALNLVFFGIALLLINFDVFDFKWRYFAYFPAIGLIYLGLMMVFNYFQEKTWGFGFKIITFLVFWGLVFLQLSPMRLTALKNDSFKTSIHFRGDEFGNSNHDDEMRSFSQNLMIPNDVNRNPEQNLNIDAGVLTLQLNDTTNNLVEAKIKGKGKNLVYSMKKNNTDSVQSIDFEPQKNENDQSEKVSGFSEVNMKLNSNYVWNINAKGGVGSYRLDLSKFKVKNFDFDGGASSLEVKFSDLNPETHVHINSEVASIHLKVPKDVACQIESEGELTSNSFKDFKKVNSNLYKTDNFETSKVKIFIHFKGELSAFKVNRY